MADDFDQFDLHRDIIFLTWVSFRLSKACITDCSGFGLCNKFALSLWSMKNICGRSEMFGELVGASCQNKNFDSGKRRALHSDTPQTRGKGIEEDYDGKCLSSLASARFHIMG